MRPIAFELTPQGFRVPLYDAQRRGDGPDPVVTEACGMLLADYRGETHTWAYQRKIINRGLDLFGDFREFLKAQDTKEALTVHQRGFLDDTIAFINTGHRPMSIETRAMMLFMEQDSKHPETFRMKRHARLLTESLTCPFEEYMYHWLRHDRGLGDMICTLNVIFGNPKVFVGVSK